MALKRREKGRARYAVWETAKVLGPKAKERKGVRPRLERNNLIQESRLAYNLVFIESSVRSLKRGWKDKDEETVEGESTHNEGAETRADPASVFGNNNNNNNTTEPRSRPMNELKKKKKKRRKKKRERVEEETEAVGRGG